MKNDESRTIQDTTADAISCLYELCDAAELYQAGGKQGGQQFVKIAYRLEEARDALQDTLSGRFDAFAKVAANPVRFGPLIFASAHEALYRGCDILVSEIAMGIVHHRFSDRPQRDKICPMPNNLPVEVDFLSAVELAIAAFFNMGFSCDDFNELGARLTQEQAHVAAAKKTDTPNSKPDSNGANSANTSQLFSGTIPKNSDLVDLAALIDAEKSKPKNERRSRNEIAREFKGETVGNSLKADSLLARLRYLRKRGRVNL